MTEFYKYKGIIQQFTAPGTPQQNGVVERKNRTLIEAGMTMLQEAKLPTYFEVEVVNTACYTQNITLVNRHGVTPYQSMKGMKPSLKHLHLFGCKCFVLRTHPEQLGKFDGKADEDIFVGYPPTRAYKVFNLRIRVVVESINVSFDDKKITGLDEDSHEIQTFQNDIDPDTVPDQNIDDPTTDDDNTDDFNATQPTQVNSNIENHDATIEREQQEQSTNSPVNNQNFTQSFDFIDSTGESS